MFAETWLPKELNFKKHLFWVLKDFPVDKEEDIISILRGSIRNDIAVDVTV